MSHSFFLIIQNCACLNIIAFYEELGNGELLFSRTRIKFFHFLMASEAHWFGYSYWQE